MQWILNAVYKLRHSVFSNKNLIVLTLLFFVFLFLSMEEFADTKEDENKKILHTYPLVRVSIIAYYCGF